MLLWTTKAARGGATVQLRRAEWKALCKRVLLLPAERGVLPYAERGALAERVTAGLAADRSDPVRIAVTSDELRALETAAAQIP